MPEPTEPKAPETQAQRPSYSRKEALRDVLLGLVIVAAVIGAYFFGRHRRASRLNAFAQCLSAKQTKMYGAFWCPHCEEQKQMFGNSFQYVTYVECGVMGSRAMTPECMQAGIKHFPTWQFSDGERREGTTQLKVLSEKTGCGLP